jgi:hypothetical protein
LLNNRHNEKSRNFRVGKSRENEIMNKLGTNLGKVEVEVEVEDEVKVEVKV